MQRGPPAGIRRIQDEILQVHRDELGRAVEFVRIRAAVGEGVARQPQAEPQRADLPAGQVEQARIARQPAAWRAVVDVGELVDDGRQRGRSEEHTSELQSLMRISYAVCCLKTKKNSQNDIR